MAEYRRTGGSGEPRRASSRKTKRKKRIIRAWIIRILFLLILAALIWGGFLGVKALIRLIRGGSGSETGSYELPDYVTENYIKVNKYSRPKVNLPAVHDIVIHSVGTPGASAVDTRDYYNDLASQSSSTAAVYASSHFIVGLDGEIIACVPLTEVAYSANNRNSDTISIEVCHPDSEGKYNDATYESLIKLTAYLCRRFDLDTEHVIRHYDVTGKLCPLYYVQNTDAWEDFLLDVQDEIYLQDADVPITQAQTTETE